MRILFLSNSHYLDFPQDDLIPYMRLHIIKRIYFFQSLKERDNPGSREEYTHGNTEYLIKQSALRNHVILVCLSPKYTEAGR